MKKQLLMCMLGLAVASPALAQRGTDKLNRDLVAVKTSKGIFCSWRIPAAEYYDVKYNIYRDGTKLNDAPLAVSNFTDKGGTVNSKYAVEAVVRGKAQTKSAEVTPWAKNYLEVKMDHGALKSTYVPNDACCADVDGDGEVEILLKFDNQSDAASGYKPGGYEGEYALIEVYKLNGKKLWWIDLGPNMGDFQNNENNIVAFDWDQDGKAEALLRAADGTVIHMADGSTKVIGDASKNYRNPNGSSGQWFIHEGDEYLLYLNGSTGEPYQIKEYPLKRLEAGETDLAKAWGDGYGHRSTKHFFGAPYLDGKHPSIFLARGIYTRHKMVAIDVDPATHELKERWRWNCNTPGSAWYGQGYHNYGIADVDMDGRDEIVYGSMVIDDNGKGLSTSGLGHGDSQHVGDFDPYTWGEEIFACNEDRPQNNFRDATTSKIYYRSTGSADDGRAIAGNFLDDYPGAQCRSAKDPNIIGGASHKALAGAPTSGIATNFRIYWDGDLLDETFDYKNGKNTEGAIYKGGYSGAMYMLEGSMTNNDTKGTPCYQGDILGDWREEVIMRTASNDIRIYTTNIETPWRNYSLWDDHQYRNAMVWQMCGYNQTPHVSYFLGQKEGITVAPPPLTTNGRTLITGGAITADTNDKHILLDTQADTEVTVSDGATPHIFTDNAPSWTQGHDNNDNITTTIYTHKLVGGAFGGAMRLVKQGEGVLELPGVVETYIGNTDVWNGTLRFDGTLLKSRLWLNRHTSLETSGGKFMGSVQADYNATIKIGKDDAASTMETDSLLLGFGSRVVFDLFSEGLSADKVKAHVLKIERKDWENGPRYNVPIFQLVKHPAAGEEKLAPGKYLLAEVEKMEGNLGDVIIEGLNAQKTELTYEDGKVYLTVSDFEVGEVTWQGSENGTWDMANTKNFKDNKDGNASAFVPGDDVVFDDSAISTDVSVVGNVAPKTITFNNDEKAYTIDGDSIVGHGTLVKNGKGNVTIKNINHIGATTINKGVLFVNALANKAGQDYGSLGDVNQMITINDNATLAITANASTDQNIKIGRDSATIYVNTGAALTMNRGITAANSQKAVLTKSGGGTLKLGSGNKASRLVMRGGELDAVESGGYVQLPSTVEMISGSIYDPNSEGSYTTNNINIVVPEGGAGSYYCDPRCEYTGSLTGKGKFTIYSTGIRTNFSGDWSQFEGTLVPGLKKRGTYDPSFEFKSSKGLGKCTLQLNEGVEFKNNGNNVAIGAISGKGTLSGSGSYTFGSNGDDIIYLTPCNSPIIKRGAGKMDIRSMGIIDGSITVEEGSLANYVLSYKTKLNGNKSVTLKGNSKFLGPSYIYSFIMNDQSALELIKTTSSAAPATFTTDAMFRASANTNVTFKISTATNYSKLAVGGNLTLGVVTVVLDDKYTPKNGDSFTLWTAAKLTDDVKSVQLPQLPEGLYWDTTGLNAATGVLRITDQSSAISSVSAHAMAEYEVYTIGGIHVGTVRAAQGALKQAVRRLGVSAGTYILRNAGKEMKLMVR